MALPAHAGHLFLSYAAADRPRALAIADALEKAGVPVWIDRRGIVGGNLWAAEIAEAIHICSHLAVLCSASSVVSRNVRQELQLAWDYDRPILPLILEPVEFPPEIAYFLHGRQWIDLLERPEDQWLAQIAAALRSHSTALALQDLTQPSRQPISSPASHLPLLPLTVVGRETDIAEVARLLQSGTRLLVLTGPGGIGKTTLAVSVAQIVQVDYPEGVWFIDLSPLRTRETAIAAIAQAVGVRELGVETSVQDLARTLHDRNALLLIDNAEHLSGIGEVVGGLLAGAPALSILVTSRRPLHLRIERDFPVQALPIPATRDLATIEASPAVRLFVGRAQTTVPSFGLDSKNAASIASICQRLDGLPLAIELAAARLRLFTPAQLLQRLEQSFSLLAGSAVDAPSRQRTLAETVLWSVEMLSAAEQALFRRLAVFVSGFTIEAAEAITQRPTEIFTDPIDVLEGVDALVDNGLVTRSETPDGELRFGMLATIHEVALDLLKASSEVIEMRNRHAEWCLDLSHVYWDEKFAGWEWIHLVLEELPDFRSALAWLEQRGDAVGYKTIAGNLTFAWNLVDNREAQQIFRRAPGRDEASDPVVHAHFLASWLSADKEWFEQNSSFDAGFAELRELSEAIGDVFGQAFAAHEMACMYVSRGEWDSATASLARARVLWQSIPQPSWDAMSGLAQGSVAFYRGNVEEAERRFQEALNANLAVGAVVLAACSETWLSLVDASQGRMGSAASRALRALWSFRATGMLTMLTGWTGAAAWIVRSVEPANAWMFGEVLRIQQATGYNYNLISADPKLLPGVAATESGGAGRAPITLDSLAALLAERLQILAS
jgi:predicted ATPase